MGREICGDEAGIRALPAETIRDFWRTTYRPANTVIAVAGDLGHDEAVALAADAFGTGNGVVPGYAAAPALPAGERFAFGARRDASQAQLVVGVPGIRRDHPDSWILSVLNAVLGDGMSSRLFLSVREELGLAYDVSSGLVDYADAGAVEVSAGVDPDGLPAALDAILAELDRLRDEDVPEQELEKAKAYLSGGLELRMDETRHLASWIGGQEALHDRVMTLEEALAEVAAVDVGRRPAGRRRALHRRRVAARGRRAREARAGGSSAGCGCRHDRDVRRPSTPADADERGAELVLARVHLRMGSMGLARAELETLAGRNGLDDEGIRDLAEVRWRTGDLPGAGEAAAAYLETKPDDALVPRDLGRAPGEPRAARRGSPARRQGADEEQRARSTGSSRGCPGARSGRSIRGRRSSRSGRCSPTCRRRPRPDIGLPIESFLTAAALADGADEAAASPAPEGPGLWDAHGGALAATLPSAAELLARSRAAVEGGRPGQAAAGLALALRADPTLAPAGPRPARRPLGAGPRARPRRRPPDRRPRGGGDARLRGRGRGDEPRAELRPRRTGVRQRRGPGERQRQTAQTARTSSGDPAHPAES